MAMITPAKIARPDMISKMSGCVRRARQTQAGRVHDRTPARTDASSHMVNTNTAIYELTASVALSRSRQAPAGRGPGTGGQQVRKHAKESRAVR
jgi:hypothetical protein